MLIVIIINKQYISIEVIWNFLTETNHYLQTISTQSQNSQFYPHRYCEKYADDIYEICIMTIFIDLLSSLSKELLSRY